MPRLATSLLLATLILVPAGCGSDDPEPPSRVPAAGEFTPPSGTPGVPEGALYDLDGTEWLALGQGEQFDAAAAFIADRLDRCESAEPVDAVPYVSVSYGNDFPLDIPVADVLLEACDAAAQGPGAP